MTGDTDGSGPGDGGGYNIQRCVGPLTREAKRLMNDDSASRTQKVRPKDEIGIHDISLLVYGGLKYPVPSLRKKYTAATSVHVRIKMISIPLLQPLHQPLHGTD